MGEKFRDSALAYKVYEKVVKGYKHPNALLKKEKKFSLHFVKSILSCKTIFFFNVAHDLLLRSKSSLALSQEVGFNES